MRLLQAWMLLAACVTIHAAGLIGMAHVMLGVDRNPQRRFGPDLWLLIVLACGIIVLHEVEIMVWALFFLWKGCLPDFGTAFYFSSITYTTVGYGDVVLPREWRSLASAEAITGILMTGLSTGYFFMVLNRIVGARIHPR